MVADLCLVLLRTWCAKVICGTCAKYSFGLGVEELLGLVWSISLDSLIERTIGSQLYFENLDGGYLGF